MVVTVADFPYVASLMIESWNRRQTRMSDDITAQPSEPTEPQGPSSPQAPSPQGPSTQDRLSEHMRSAIFKANLRGMATSFAGSGDTQTSNYLSDSATRLEAMEASLSSIIARAGANPSRTPDQAFADLAWINDEANRILGLLS